MALEIREMILRTTLIDETSGSAGKKQAANTPGSAINTEHIIAECMERLMEWLKEQNER